MSYVVICQRLYRFYTENQQHGKHSRQQRPYNHGSTVPIYKYSKQGITVKTTLKTRNIGTRIISTLLRLVLTLNNFVFNSQNYLQIKGCAMGTKCAPSYANIFMGMLEERYIYQLIEKNFYLLFIDGIF